MRKIGRRSFVKTIGVTLSGMAAAGKVSDVQAQTGHKMRMALSCGAIGVKAGQLEAIEYASKHGFEAVEPYVGYLSGLSDGQVTDLLGQLKAKGLTWAVAGLPVDFRKDDAKFAADMAELPKAAAALRRAGVERVGTWIMPSHPTLPYIQHFRLHATRLREAAKVLKDHGARLGLEYVGPRTLLVSQKYPFIHTKAELQELIGEIGTGNVGYVLDTFHWWTSGDTKEDILSLKAVDVVGVDLNDAAAGVPREEQQDGKRELPCATGVIDSATFLNALASIGYDGPVRVEPFNQAVRALPPEEALAVTAAALKKAMAQIR
jgi:sugar phosphate isomerase/epimerase